MQTNNQTTKSAVLYGIDDDPPDVARCLSEEERSHTPECMPLKKLKQLTAGVDKNSVPHHNNCHTRWHIVESVSEVAKDGG
mmetsp:Transcript_18200/g.20946  ORF Transcript_18200/g.20946 Transcript_18200/m.20946 type:complete len:81 (-) Transcript_18200:829-1071(-)